MEVLLEILDWINKSSAPNEQFKYSRCKICGHAWWDDKEEHNFNCWVPRLKKAAEQSVQRTVDQPCVKHNMEFCVECFPVVSIDLRSAK